MSFEYVARDPLGKTLKGSVEAANRDAAMQILQRDGFQVMKLDGQQRGGDLIPRRVKKSEIIYFTSQLAIMVDTGINLAVALEGIADQEQNPTLKRIVTELKLSVESGDNFSTALSRHPKQFDRTYVSLVRASEETGSLAEMLDRIATYQRKELETRGKVRAALAYPAVMLVIAIAVTVFLLTHIMPKFTPLFERKGTDLPKPTIFMMSVSDLMIEHWYLWLAGAVALIVTFLIGKRTEPGKSGNHFYEKTWMQVHHEVTNGNRICDSLTGNPLFPPTLVQMIGSGEETGKLDQVLDKVSTHYDHEVDVSLRTATRLIEPLMITVMGVVVGAIGMSLLLPIFSLSRGGM